MFVANHSSWDDIPFLGATIGFRNYKIVSKKELEKVPILGKAIRVAGNVEVDRSDRRSQLATLKKGIKYLKVSTAHSPAVVFHLDRNNSFVDQWPSQKLNRCFLSWTKKGWCELVHFCRRN